MYVLFSLSSFYSLHYNSTIDSTKDSPEQQAIPSPETLQQQQQQQLLVGDQPAAAMHASLLESLAAAVADQKHFQLLDLAAVAAAAAATASASAQNPNGAP